MESVEKSEVGKWCWDGSIGELLALDRGEFKKYFKKNFSHHMRYIIVRRVRGGIALER